MRNWNNHLADFPNLFQVAGNCGLGCFLIQEYFCVDRSDECPGLFFYFYLSLSDVSAEQNFEKLFQT